MPGAQQACARLPGRPRRRRCGTAGAEPCAISSLARQLLAGPGFPCAGRTGRSAARARATATRRIAKPQAERPILLSLREIPRSLFSLEALVLLYMFAGLYKDDPRFAWIPVDPTALFFALSVLVGSFIIVLNPIPKRALAHRFRDARARRLVGGDLDLVAEQDLRSEPRYSTWPPWPFGG